MQNFFQKQRQNNQDQQKISLFVETQTKLIWVSLSEFQRKYRKSSNQNSCLNIEQYEKPVVKFCQSYLNCMQTKRFVDTMHFQKDNTRNSFNLIVFIIDYNSVKNQKTEILEFFDIKQKLYVSFLHIKRQEVDAPIGPTFLHYFKNNSMNIENYNLSKLDLVIQVSDEMYFKEITNFGQTARITLLSNMCDIVGKYTQCSLKPCQKYLNGIVTKGFGQKFDLLMQNAKKVKQQSLQEFGLHTCTQQECPPYFEHEFVSILMGQTIRYIIFKLNKQMNRIFDVLMELTKLKIVYKYIGMLVALILYFVCDRSLRNRRKRAIKYFRIVPKEVMCSTKLTTFMRKQKFLSKFDIL